MPIKKGDFVEIEFVARLTENNQLFDLTDEALAKKERVHNPHMTYGPRIICVGEDNIVKGVDAFLDGKDVQKSYTITLAADQAFGKKNPRLIKMMPLSLFTKQRLKPFPGLQVTMDNMLATIKSVSGGRVIVDFNHPVAGHDVTYHLTITRVITDDKEKITHLLANTLGPQTPFTLAKGHLTITLPFEMPADVKDKFTTELKRLVPAITSVTFTKKEHEQTTKNDTHTLS